MRCDNQSSIIMGGGSGIGKDSSPSCSLCGHSNNPVNNPQGPVNLLGVVDTPECLVIKYQCPSCSMRVVEVFQGNVGRVKGILEEMTSDLIRKLGEIKDKKRRKGVEPPMKKGRGIGQSLSSSSDSDKSTPPSPDNHQEQGGLKNEDIKEEVWEEDEYLLNEGVLIENEDDDDISDVLPKDNPSFEDRDGTPSSISEECPHTMNSVPFPVPELGTTPTPPEPERGNRNEVLRVTYEVHRCPHCPMLLYSSCSLQDHIQSIHEINPKPKLFICSNDGCDKSYGTLAKCRIHERTHSNPTNLLKCPDCPEASFKTKDDLDSHRITVHEVGQCPSPNNHPGSGKGFIRKVMLKEHHDLNQHYIDGEWGCPEDGCGKEFPNKKYLICHLKLHKEGIESLKCPQCSKEFDNYISFTRHEEIHQKKYACVEPSCGRNFGTRSGLKAHIISHANCKDKDYLCDKCGEALQSRNLKYLHMKNVHCQEETFKCSDCPGVSFKGKDALVRHLCSTHGQAWPLPCPHSGCGKGFLFQRELNHHKDIWHSEGKHVCPHAGCGKEFPHNKFLKAHEELHSKGITSLKCETCGKEYDNYKSFKKHQKLHEQTLQFPCPQCSKLFKSHVSLKGHIDRHKGLRKFQCEACGRSFPSSGNLRTHQRHVHERGGKPRPTRVGRLENSGDGTG